MDNFNEKFPENLYHSYVIEGNPDDIIYRLHSLLIERNQISAKSPDLFINLYDSFTINDSYTIKSWHNNKPIDSKKKICIIGAKFINHDAEQTLLKIIEEPKDDTHFFIIVPDTSLLQETIISRVHLINNLTSIQEMDNSYTIDFLKSTPNKRIEMVSLLINEFKNNTNSGGLRHRSISLINEIEMIIYEKWKKDINNRHYIFVLNELKNCRAYLSNPGCNTKMIIEHVALVI